MCIVVSTRKTGPANAGTTLTDLSTTSRNMEKKRIIRTMSIALPVNKYDNPLWFPAMYMQIPRQDIAALSAAKPSKTAFSLVMGWYVIAHILHRIPSSNRQKSVMNDPTANVVA